MEDLSGSLRLLLIALQTRMRFAALALSGFGLFFGVSFDGGHGALLQTVMLAMHGWKDTMPPKGSDFKNFHGRPRPVSLNPTTTFLFDIGVTTRYVSPASPREQQEAADVTSLSD